MRTAVAIVVLLSVVGLCGCESSSPRGGGASPDEGFKIVVGGATKVKQGQVETVNVSLKRGEYFKRDVTLEIKAPDGIRVEPTKVVVKASDKADVQLRVSAVEKAALGEYRVYITGTPEAGEPASVDFNVKVVAP